MIELVKGYKIRPEIKKSRGVYFEKNDDFVLANQKAALSSATCNFRSPKAIDIS